MDFEKRANDFWEDYAAECPRLIGLEEVKKLKEMLALEFEQLIQDYEYDKDNNDNYLRNIVGW